MPCRDWDDGVQYVYEDTQETRALVGHLRARNDTLMTALCAMNKWARGSTDRVQYKMWLLENPGIYEIMLEHDKADEAHWFEVYSKQYPNFTKEEIAKMVRAGILEDK